MADYSKQLTDIAASARICWTCGGTPNPANFGGLCDSCNEQKRQRNARSVKVLEETGNTNSQVYRALKFLGY